MEPTTVTATFYVAADHHDKHMRVIATEQQDRTFVYDELEQMIKSFSDDLYYASEKIFEHGDYESDHRKFRLTMSIEEVTE